MSTITVREVLTLPVLQGTFVVAGHGGLGRAVTGVNVMEVPDIESFVKGGELLLTTAYPLREHPEDLGALVRTLARLGLAGLAVKTGRYLERLPGEALAIADELDFPVMLVAEHTSFNEVIGAVLAVVLTEYGAEPASAEAIRERLTGVALAGGGLVEIARTLAGALGRHVAILDPDGALLGAGGAGEVPDAAPPSDAATWSFPITVGGIERGRIVVRGDHEPTLGQRRLIRQACFAGGMHIAQAAASLELDRQMRVLFLEELLTGQVIDESLVRERSRLFGWDFGPDHVVVLARTSNELSDAAVGRAAASELERGSVAWARGHEAVAIVSAASIPAGTSDWPLAEHWGEALKRRGAGQVTVATGSVAASVSQLAVSHTAARSALAIAHATGRTNVRYDQLVLERVILAVPDALLAELVDHELGPLIAVDATTGSELCATLEMFLGTGNAADAARRLFIHYNTMKHRMARISDLIAVDLHDPRARLTLAFALQVRKLIAG
ncbi:MAG: PucR family transcriptional regulator ligand-binding domain-containing protein [Salinibacterium sp.]|nr:PucR family transcriptional regulator ligand-binding domain-containing protein [Salinibacterium sp.]